MEQNLSPLSELENHLLFISNEKAVLLNSLSTKKDEQRAFLVRTKELEDSSELLQKTSEVLKQLIATVSEENIERIEFLVTSALNTIFYDMVPLTFSIKEGEARNATQYSLEILDKDSHQMGIHSMGGGIWATAAFILKILINILTTRLPLICFDESLSFLSRQYISHFTSFINELSEQFHTSILLVTHQDEFTDIESLDVLTIIPDGQGGQTFKLKSSIKRESS